MPLHSQESCCRKLPPSHHSFLQILRKSLQSSLRQMQLKFQIQTLKDILYNAYDVRFEVRDDTPCLLYREQEEETGFLSEYLWT